MLTVTAPESANPLFAQANTPVTPPANPFAPGATSRFSFVGTTREYFGIWLVNIVLTVLTFGVYGSWAKVRRLRFFYGHTLLRKERFDFTGEGSKVFLGRLIGLVLSTVLTTLFPAFGVLISLLLMPWLLRATYRFKARNSVWGNTPFYFAGSLWDAYKTYGVGFIVTALTLGLGFPYAYYLNKRYQFDNLFVGQQPFRMNTRAGTFFVIMIVPLLILVATAVATLLVLGAALASGSMADESAGSAWAYLQTLFEGIGGVVAVVGVVVWVLSLIYTGGALFRKVWDEMRVGQSPMHCQMSVWRYTLMVVVNAVARFISFGLLTPWAQVRMHRLKTNAMSITWQDDPDGLLTLSHAQVSAFGEELAGILDVNLSL